MSGTVRKSEAEAPSSQVQVPPTPPVLMTTLISCLVLLGLAGASVANIDDDYTKWDLAKCDEPGYGDCVGSGYPDGCVCSRPSRSMRAMIVNGTEAKRYRYCFICGLVYNTIRYCASTAINERYVMTAAHCTDGFTAKDLKVVCGVHTFDDSNYPRTAQVRDALEIIEHPGYNPKENFNNDIALIKLNSSLRFTFNVCPVCMPSSCIHMYYEPEILIIGWGAGMTGGPQSKNLMEGCSRPISTTSCAGVYGRFVDQTCKPSIHLCHEQKDGGTCQGDSGGPVLISDKKTKCLVLQGVTSYGSSECGDYRPSVSTRVCRYMNWIIKHIEHTTLCYIGPPDYSDDCY